MELFLHSIILFVLVDRTFTRVQTRAMKISALTNVIRMVRKLAWPVNCVPVKNIIR